jgi:3-methyl-2-oxobutanoate hydroxymethyltransferase
MGKKKHTAYDLLLPRHSRVYRHFLKEYERLQKERIAAYKEYIHDVQNKTFNDPKITVDIDEGEFERIMKSADSI